MIATENGFASVEIVTTRGPRTMPCEVVAPGLVIVPAFGEDETGASTLMGGFSVTHTGSGRMITHEQACLNCARRTADRLARSGVDWAAFEFTSQDEVKSQLGDRLAEVEAARAEFGRCPHVGGSR